MQMVRLAACGPGMPWTSRPSELRRAVGGQRGWRAGLFDDFAAPGIPDFGVFGLHVAAGQQPAVEAPVVDQQQPVAIRGQHQAGAGDMAGGELGARERGRGAIEEQEDEFAALEGRPSVGS